MKRKLTKPVFTADQFTPTRWSSAADKAKFANHFVRFVANDFPAGIFYRDFYTRLSNCFGHIAHYDRGGFYSVWFTSTERKLAFVQRVLDFTCYGSPEYTFCDVEKVLRAWLRENELHLHLAVERGHEVMVAEKAQLAHLQAKYGRPA